MQGSLVIRPKVLVKALRRHGFVVSRQKGSHVFMKRESDKLTTVVPIHNKDIGKGLLKKILNDCNLSIDELRKLL